MIALFLLIPAASSEATPAASPPAHRVCRRAAGSDTVVCGPAPQQQTSYRLPKYGPAAPNAEPGNDVKVRAQATNRGAARHNRSMATVGIPF